MIYEIISINKINDEDIDYIKVNYPLRYQKALKYSFHDDFLRCIGGYRLLDKMIGKFDEADVYYNENEKPFIKNKPFFNISHSGAFVLVAVDENEIGVDIEVIKESNLKLAERVFTPEEIEWMNEKDAAERFHMLWCKKESSMKCIGTGITTPFEKFKILTKGKVMFEETVLKNETFKFKDEYIVSITSK